MRAAGWATRSIDSQKEVDVVQYQPILVTGFPRSGTSLTAGILARGGVWSGNTVPGNKHNEKGYFENVALREQVVKPILSGLGCDPLGIRRLPGLASIPSMPFLRRLVLHSIRSEGYIGDRPWMYKGAKLTLIWPVWAAAFPAAEWVVVRRPPTEVVRSCLRTPFMAQHSTDPEFWTSAISAYDERLAALAGTHQVHEIMAKELLAHKFDRVRSLFDRVGIPWNEGVACRLVDKGLWGE